MDIINAYRLIALVRDSSLPVLIYLCDLSALSARLAIKFSYNSVDELTLNYLLLS